MVNKTKHDPDRMEPLTDADKVAMEALEAEWLKGPEPLTDAENAALDAAAIEFGWYKD